MSQQPHPPANALSSKEAEAQHLPASPVVSFSKLSHDGQEVLIEHNGQVYRLRLTKNGKLILNK